MPETIGVPYVRYDITRCAHFVYADTADGATAKELAGPFDNAEQAKAHITAAGKLVGIQRIVIPELTL